MIVVESKKLNGEKDYIKIVPELVLMTGITDEQKADFGVMKRVAEVTKKDPSERMDII